MLMFSHSIVSDGCLLHRLFLFLVLFTDCQLIMGTIGGTKKEKLTVTHCNLSLHHKVRSAIAQHKHFMIALLLHEE